MDVYKSENSSYRIEDGNLIRVKDLKENNLGKDFVYISTRDFVNIAKKHKIKFNKAKILEDKVGDNFLIALREKEMDSDKTGGRYVVLKKGPENYALFYSGIITEKINSKPEIEQSELKLSDDKAVN